MGAGPLDRAAAGGVPLEPLPRPVLVADLDVHRQGPQAADVEAEGDRLALDHLGLGRRPGRPRSGRAPTAVATKQDTTRTRRPRAKAKRATDPSRAAARSSANPSRARSRAPASSRRDFLQGVFDDRRLRPGGGAPATVWIRWARTGPASACTSSGTTKSRPSSAAWARAAASSMRPPRGLAPASLSGWRRVASRIATTYSSSGRRASTSATAAIASAASSSSATERHRGRRRRGEQVGLGPAGGIAEREAGHEAVELRGRQGVGAVEAGGRVLRRDHRERARQRVRLAFDRDLQLGHRLEQPGLRFRRRPVQLVDEDDVGEDRAGVELEGLRAGAPDRRPEDVARQQVDGALDPGEAAADRWRRGCGPAGSCRPPAGPRAAGDLPPGRVQSTTCSISLSSCIPRAMPPARCSPHAATPVSENRTARNVAMETVLPTAQAGPSHDRRYR